MPRWLCRWCLHAVLRPLRWSYSSVLLRPLCRQCLPAMICLLCLGRLSVMLRPLGWGLVSAVLRLLCRQCQLVIVHRHTVFAMPASPACHAAPAPRALVCSSAQAHPTLMRCTSSVTCAVVMRAAWLISVHGTRQIISATIPNDTAASCVSCPMTLKMLAQGHWRHRAGRRRRVQGRGPGLLRRQSEKPPKAPSAKPQGENRRLRGGGRIGRRGVSEQSRGTSGRPGGGPAKRGAKRCA